MFLLQLRENVQHECEQQDYALPGVIANNRNCRGYSLIVMLTLGPYSYKNNSNVSTFERFI